MESEPSEQRESTIFIKNLPEDLTVAVFCYGDFISSSNLKKHWMSTDLFVEPLLLTFEFSEFILLL